MIYCRAIVPDQEAQYDLCERVERLGATPTKYGDKIAVQYAGDNEKAIIKLFQQFPLSLILPEL